MNCQCRLLCTKYNYRMEIQAHHRRAIDRLVDEYRDDPLFSALIIGGSVAKGCARPDSDVDFLIVATDEEFIRRREQEDLFINRKDLCDYDGGYVDGKIINHSYLEKLADKGNEPSRAAFEGAFAAYSHIPDLDGLLKKIPVYIERDRDRSNPTPGS
jgi:predicted nucleotidyltransferase